ncbi:MAG: tRNA preQ1(34) S-adenosylmethionine ribosyltransferase-isomerase QueA [Acidimicrobiia bacterium]
MDISSFDYDLPEDRIAQTPVEPRHSSRLLDTRHLSDHVFLDLADLLEPGDLVVVNRTRVRPARLHGVKQESGGAVELLLLRRLPDDRWDALVRPARRLRAGSRLRFGDLEARIETDPVDGMAIVSIDTDGDIEAAVARVGEMPLPPYITARLENAERYQTMFADRPGSAAAPTAGLHFTPAVVQRLTARGVEMATVELEVGLATFRPIGVDRIEDHVMHRELCRIDQQAAGAVADCRNRGGRVVAVGTTTVRTLESFARPDGTVGTGELETDLYLTPGSPIHVVDLMVTNFHMPRSSLLVLLEAFMGPGWRPVYDAALSRGYRFLSFGDAMICERVSKP